MNSPKATSDTPRRAESLNEILRRRRDEDADFLAPKGPQPWRECDLFLLPSGRLVWPDGSPVFRWPSEAATADETPMAETIFRRCGCREDDGQVTRACADHRAAA